MIGISIVLVGHLIEGEVSNDTSRSTGEKIQEVLAPETKVFLGKERRPIEFGMDELNHPVRGILIEALRRQRESTPDRGADRRPTRFRYMMENDA